MFRIQRQHNPRIILDDKDRLIANIEAYFNGTEPPWMPNELARAIGFSSFSHLKRYLAQSYIPSFIDEAQQRNPKNTPIPQDCEAFYILDQAFSAIEDDYLRNAILDEYKFAPVEAAISIYFNKIKVKKSEAFIESQSHHDHTLNIIIGDDNQSPQQLQQLEEKKRLQAATAIPVTNQAALDIHDIL